MNTNAAQDRVLLFTFKWGSNTARFARSEIDLDIDGDIFTAFPELEPIKLELAGGARIESLKIEAPSIVEPLGILAANEPAASVELTYEVIDVADLASRKLLYTGISGVNEPVEGDDNDLIRYEFRGLKRFFSSKVGLRCTERCQWWLGHPVCGVSVTTTAAQVSGIGVASIDQRLSLTFPGGAPDLDPDRYRNGAIVFDGLPLSIVESYDDSTFDLLDAPPASWLGETVELRTGCDNRPETCLDTWDNITQITIMGRHMPDRHMLTEAGNLTIASGEFERVAVS